MARTELNVIDLANPFDVPLADAADITYDASDDVNGNFFTCIGRELIIANNTDGAANYYVSIPSTADEKGRVEDIDQYSLAPGESCVFTVGLTTSKGWQNTDKTIHIDTENPAIELVILRIPTSVGR